MKFNKKLHFTAFSGHLVRMSIMTNDVSNGTKEIHEKIQSRMCENVLHEREVVKYVSIADHWNEFSIRPMCKVFKVSSSRF